MLQMEQYLKIKTAEEYMNIKPDYYRMSVEELTIYPDKEYKGENE